MNNRTTIYRAPRARTCDKLPKNFVVNHLSMLLQQDPVTLSSRPLTFRTLCSALRAEI